MAKSRSGNKKPSTKTRDAEPVARSDRWTIVSGELKRAPGRPDTVESRFKAVAEKIPYEFIEDVSKSLDAKKISKTGIYIAHDSMGYPRYIGRGQNVFTRLRARRDAQVLELAYFSLYIVVAPKHIREIETTMIRAAGPLLHFNERKKRVDIQSGDIKDYEPVTAYVERQYKRGGKRKPAGRKKAPRS